MWAGSINSYLESIGFKSKVKKLGGRREDMFAIHLSMTLGRLRFGKNISKNDQQKKSSIVPKNEALQELDQLIGTLEENLIEEGKGP